MTDHILLSHACNGTGGSTLMDNHSIAKCLKDDALAWVHLDGNHPDTKAWLEHEIAYLDPFVIKALLENETRPRMTQIGQGALLILRGVNLNKDADPEDMVSVRIWLDAYRIITIERRKLRAIWDIDKRLQHGKGPKDSGEFISLLSANLFERMEPVLSELDDLIDIIEETLLESADNKLRESIIDARKQAIIFRRYIAPQRDAIAQLRMADFSWLDDGHRRHLQESFNHVTRYVEDLDAMRERAQIVKDELANILTDRLNKNMYVLSVIAAIFLPLGFLTGLLGVNVGGMPGADNDYAFWIFSAALIVIVILQIWVFKKFKWF